MFADDSKFYRIIKTPKDVEILQEDLHFISKWSSLWLLKFNILKCTVLHLGRGDNNTYTQASGARIHNWTKIYIGIWITPDMSSSLHCHKIASNANEDWSVASRIDHQHYLHHFTKHWFDLT